MCRETNLHIYREKFRFWLKGKQIITIWIRLNVSMETSSVIEKLLKKSFVHFFLSCYFHWIWYYIESFDIFRERVSLFIKVYYGLYYKFKLSYIMNPIDIKRNTFLMDLLRSNRVVFLNKLKHFLKCVWQS